MHNELPGLAPRGRHGGEGARATIRIAINADSLATWFVGALAEFCRDEATLIDIALDDQDLTSGWLRRGHVLAAVTSLAKPVQGCRSRRLGVLRYCATASPAFAARWFGAGIDAESLARAPSLRFDRNDRLQDQWVRRLVRRDVALPVHRMPSSQAFVDAALAGIGWGMNPLALVGGHLKAKRLVELVPDRPLDVPLYWQVARLPVPVLDRLTRCVTRAADAALGP